MCRVDSIKNHVDRATEYTSLDADRHLYQKTVDKYDTEVITSLVNLTCALSKVLGKKITVSIEDRPVESKSVTPSCNFAEPPGVVQLVYKDSKSSKKKSRKQDKKVKKLEKKVRKLEKSVSELVEQNKQLVDCLAQTNKTLLQMSKKTSEDAKPSKEAGKTKVYGSSEPVPVKQEKQVERKSNTTSSSASKKTSVKGVKKTFHKYFENQVRPFHDVLKSMLTTDCQCDGYTSIIADAVLPWYENRYVDSSSPYAKGNKCYKLYHFPFYLAYFCGFARKSWDENPIDNLKGDLEPFVSNEDSGSVVVPAPSFLLQSSDDHEELTEDQAVRGYAVWLRFVEAFNCQSKKLKAGVYLYPDQYTSKMSSLGFVSDEVLNVMTRCKTADSFVDECNNIQWVGKSDA